MIGMDNLDNKILVLLGREAIYPSEISRKLGILRTTIQYRLSRLHRAGLVEKNIIGRKSLWRPVFRNTHNKNHYRIYKGGDIVQAYRQLLNLPSQSTILAVQGTGAAKSEFDNLPLLFIKEAHKILKRKGIIMKGISNEKSVKLFDNLNADIVRSHIGRPQGLKVFSDEKFTASGELMSTAEFLLLSNPKTKVALVIKDVGVTKIVNDAMKLLFELMEGSKNFDLNSYLKSKVSAH